MAGVLTRPWILAINPQGKTIDFMDSLHRGDPSRKKAPNNITSTMLDAVRTCCEINSVANHTPCILVVMYDSAHRGLAFGVWRTTGLILLCGSTPRKHTGTRCTSTQAQTAITSPSRRNPCSYIVGCGSSYSKSYSLGIASCKMQACHAPPVFPCPCPPLSPTQTHTHPLHHPTMLPAP